VDNVRSQTQSEVQQFAVGNRADAVQRTDIPMSAQSLSERLWRASREEILVKVFGRVNIRLSEEEMAQVDKVNNLIRENSAAETEFRQGEYRDADFPYLEINIFFSTRNSFGLCGGSIGLETPRCAMGATKTWRWMMWVPTTRSSRMRCWVGRRM
jgi:hypothetical protein